MAEDDIAPIRPISPVAGYIEEQDDEAAIPDEAAINIDELDANNDADNEEEKNEAEAPAIRKLRKYARKD